jgi:FkbM family methyltransferase
MKKAWRKLGFLFSLRKENSYETFGLRLRLLLYHFSALLVRLIPFSSLRMKLMLMRWSKFLRWAENTTVYSHERGIWLDLAHFYTTGGQGDFPTEWMRFAPGEIGFQVGANRGEYTFWAAKEVSPSGLCVALEPNPEVYLMLVELLSLNRFAHVIALPLACGKTFERAWFSADSTALLQFGDGVFKKVSGPGEKGKGFYAQVVPLDSLVTGLGMRKVDFIIIDVEGAEGEVLAGAEETLRKYKPRLYIELHPGTYEEVQSRLHSLGYEIASLSGDPTVRAHLLALPSPVTQVAG